MADDGAASLRAALAASEQRLAELQAAQEEFLRAVSHDLRAPLRHVTACGQLAREVLQPEPGAAAQEALGYLATADRSARQMGRMIDGLLELSRIARARLNVAPVDVRAVVDEVRLQLEAAEPARAVVWQVDAQLPSVAGDGGWLRALWTHLLSNAWKFSRQRTPAHIAVTASVAAGEASFEIRDDGAGFNPAQAGRLFGVFQRLHRESEFEGTGTGLAAAQAIARRHGGRIAIDGAPQQGCAVRLVLPVR
ncbi:sensor histidine kinase [Xylophilus sp.]|uniref:sensor histidine kinase n=1 Tax=Xylophilus sp. TaxID=2653893 RepID=UPI0013B63688|nr:ATP-binding protein [Xylophilus sp.]KAF1046437.1 MAG: Phytochrome-like protein cph1 [Xylophilus sp.]